MLSRVSFLMAEPAAARWSPSLAKSARSRPGDPSPLQKSAFFAPADR